jgi:seryl-tRNA synthetase
MKEQDTIIKDRVRENTSEEQNLRIDKKVVNKVFKYRKLSPAEITDRIEKLYNEWDVERALELNAASLAVTGFVLGRLFGRAWYLVPFVAVGFLLQQGIQGWCPPVTLLRRLGFRTRQEIDEEIYALKVLRGDFDTISSVSGPVEILANYRK